jgi:hypothetical protein
MKVEPTSAYKAIDGQLFESKQAALDHSLAAAGAMLFNRIMGHAADLRPDQAITALLEDFSNAQDFRSLVAFLLDNLPRVQPGMVADSDPE